jgi:hypothetical protein
MNTNLTEIAIVLDRSGSMASMSNEAIGGFNSFLESQQKLPGEAKLTLVLFDNEYIVACDGRLIKDVPLSMSTLTFHAEPRRSWTPSGAPLTRLANVWLGHQNLTGPARCLLSF